MKIVGEFFFGCPFYCQVSCFRSSNFFHVLIFNDVEIPGVTEAQIKAQGFDVNQRYFKGPLVVSLGADGVVPLTVAALGAYNPAANSTVTNN